jgi:hypothetical protein
MRSHAAGGARVDNTGVAENVELILRRGHRLLATRDEQLEQLRYRPR